MLFVRAMNLTSRRPVLLGLLLILSLTAARPALAEKELRWKFTAGQKLRQSMTQEMQVGLSSGDQPASTSNVSQILDMDWEVQAVDDEGTAEIVQQIRRVQMTVAGPLGIGFSFDTASDEEPSGPARKIAPALKALTQTAFTVKMNTRGQALDVVVPPEALKALQAIPGAQEMGQLFTRDGLKEMVEQGSPVFPDGSVEEGSKWTSQFRVAMSRFGKMKIASEYTYEGEEKDGAEVLDRIGVQMKLSLEPDEKVVGKDNLKLGNQEAGGSMLFDNAAGHIVRSVVNQKMVLEIKIADKVIKKAMTQKVAMELSEASE